MSYWKRIKENPYKWLHGFNEIMSCAAVPKFGGDYIFIGSDYSGSEKSSNHIVISMLFMDFMNCKDWILNQSFLRKHFLPNNRRMSYKNLGDQERRKALIPFLEVASLIRGFSLSIVISKKIGGLITAKDFGPKLKSEGKLKSEWNPYELENMARIAFFISAVLGGIAKENQNITWISDEDPMAANVDKMFDLTGIVSTFTSHFVNHTLGKLNFGTTAIDPGDRIEEDITAIPDLVCGTVADIISHLSKTNNYWMKDIIIPETIKDKSKIIFSWLIHDHEYLKSSVIVFEKDELGNVVTFPFFDR